MQYKEQPHGSRCGMLLNGGIPCDLTKLPKCQATSKSTGKRCRQPAMKNKRVCRFHGGMSPGAKRGNRNALKHGFNTADALHERRVIRKLIEQAKETLCEINDGGDDR